MVAGMMCRGRRHRGVVQFDGLSAACVEISLAPGSSKRLLILAVISAVMVAIAVVGINIGNIRFLVGPVAHW